MNEKEQQILLLIVIAAVVCLVALVIGIAFYHARRLKRKLYEKELDGMDGRQFEFFCAKLLEENGFYEVEVTKGSGDYGVDVLAEKDGVTYAVQCKRYDSPVGVKAIQEACAGREYYDRMVGAVMTNQYFTQPAVEAARKLKILMWDRELLEEWMGDMDS